MIERYQKGDRVEIVESEGEGCSGVVCSTLTTNFGKQYVDVEITRADVGCDYELIGCILRKRATDVRRP